MSTFRAPSERRNTFNPTFYTQADEGVTVSDLDTKLSKIGDTSISQTLANASFTGATSFAGATVTGLPVSTITNNNIVNTSVTTDFMDRTYDKQDQAIQTMPDDVIAYYDFSNSSAVGYDFSGRGHHLTNPFAVESSSDVTRTYVAKLTDRRTTASVLNVSATNGTVLVSDNTDIATAFKSTPSFSVSFWIKPETSSVNLNGYIWDCADVSSALNATYPTRPRNRIRMGYSMSSQVIFLQIYDQSVGSSAIGYVCTPIVARNTWTHVTFTRSFTTNTNIWYLNGVAVAGTTPGFNPDHRNLALTKFSVGASICPEVLVVQNIATPSYTEFFRGSISDLLFTARDISAEEVLKIYNDDYGASVIVVAGQSNAVGYCDLVSGIDDVYTGLQGRVFQYDTTTNTPNPGTVVATTVSPATNPLNMPVIRAGSTGFWKSFCEDMLKYSNLPFRRKILLVPCANPGQNIAFFKSGAQGGETIKNATNSALDLSKLNRLTAFLWHQGENDIQEQNLNYKADFLAVIANFQSTITGFTSTLPKITGEVSALYYDTFLSANGLTHMKTFHRQKMQEICTADASYRYVRTNDLTYYDGSHFDAPAQRAIGSRYFDAMIDVLGQPSLRLETSAVRKRVKVLESAVTIASTKVTALQSADTALDGRVVLLESAMVAKAPLANPSFTGIVSGVTKAMVALGNVNNTADEDKPISTQTKAYVDTKVSDLVNSAPATLDTLSELATALGNDVNFATTVSTLIGLRAPLANPSFTGTVSGVTKAMVALGNVTNTADADKPVSTAQQTALDAKLNGLNGVATGFLGFDNVGANALTHWGTGRFGSICSNLTGGNGELAFCNHNVNNPTSSGPGKTFVWNKYTSATTKTVQASMTYDGAFDVPGTITGPTITGLQAADTALQGRALLLEDGVSLLGARVGILEAGSGAPTFQNLTQGSTTVETNASLKNVYFLTVSANSNTTLTFPDLVPGDSKYSGFSIKVRVRSGSATETLTLTCPASPSAFVPMAAGRYNSKVFNALDSYVEYVTAEGDYVELVSTAVN